MKPLSLWLVLVGMLVSLGTAVDADARRNAPILYVANNGVDSPTCGDDDRPCRSISQAIVNASPGDRIVVGPGHYGDLNRNGNFGEPGEEFGQEFGMITVDKRVSIFSSDGPLTTVIDATGARNAVFIAADGVAFGGLGHGFLLTGAGGNGLGSASPSNITGSNITVAGNIAVANAGAGFAVAGNRNLVVHSNFASGNGASGFGIFGTGAEVRHNVASRNGSEGFVVTGTAHVVRHNMAQGNAHGFGIQGSGIQLKFNSALGNKFAGVYLIQGASGTIIRNSIYGNNNAPINGQVNCGVQNDSGNVIDATNNFWGSRGGPGPDPADDAGPGSACDRAGSVTTVVPFAVREFGL